VRGGEIRKWKIENRIWVGRQDTKIEEGFLAAQTPLGMTWVLFSEGEKKKGGKLAFSARHFTEVV
jgi:hypothetical protein